jgi:hypothetical protein
MLFCIAAIADKILVSVAFSLGTEDEFSSVESLEFMNNEK